MFTPHVSNLLLTLIEYPQMRTLPVFLFFAILSACQSNSPSASHKVVVGISTEDSATSLHTLINISNMQTVWGTENEIEVVFYGHGTGWIREAHNPFGGFMDTLAMNGVNFSACAKSMTAFGLGEKDLFRYIKIVPSGAAKMITLQEKGYHLLPMNLP